jgi:hypothetical protein
MKIDPRTKVMGVKLLQSRYLDSFLDGNLYMNSAAYFKTLESDGGVRADSDEGLESAFQVKELSIQDKDGTWVPIGGLTGPVRYWTDESANFNMFCLYLLTDQADAHFDDKNLGFGDTFVVLTNFPEFIRRVRAAAEALGRTCNHGPIEYVSREHHNGPMGPFRKFSDYQFQNEFRIVLKGGESSATTLSIGDIRDICQQGRLSELNDFIQTVRSMPIPTIANPSSTGSTTE